MMKQETRPPVRPSPEAVGPDEMRTELNPDPSAETPALVEMDSVSIAYGDKEVVHEVSLSVAQGEVMALIGPSGAGKSSLLRTVNYLEKPSNGRITVAGHVIEGGQAPKRRDLLALRRDVGMVFQSFNLFPHLSALDNVALAQVYSLKRSKSEARARAEIELERVGLPKAMHGRRPTTFSGGQQQRIAIARSLSLDPKLMLFDEPTSALDPELGWEVLGTMRELAATGMTMLVVTHEMHFARDVAEEVVFMADGRVVEQGPPEQIMTDPRHERTRQFLRVVLDR
ncbi:amino acid ABC transporter ATP-binding protein [Brevibacterium samyangense]|uniref:Amino acid ABC transporter ATP-binding protein n=1 Tax=Brevibacterium samyangense TaxID=366888 RepID=A0ABP5EQ08_9MICO